jgi:hypothetical protein
MESVRGRVPECVGHRSGSHSVSHSTAWSQSPLKGAGLVSDGSVEGASIRGEVVLVLDQDESRGLGVRERLALIACPARA